MKKDEHRSDPALEEIWAIRDRIWAEFDYDIHKLAAFYREYQKKFGDRLVPPPDRSNAQRSAA